MAMASMPADYDYPVPIPGPSFGDSQCGMAMAGGIAAALYHRERTGRGCVVDVSLLSAGLWAAQGTNVGACLSGEEALPRYDRRRPTNPLATTYRTADGRFVALGLLEADRHWPAFCESIGQGELRTDPRFSTAEARRENIEACVAILEGVFSERRLDEWIKLLEQIELPFGVVRTPKEAQHDPQARINGFIQDLPLDAGLTLPVTIAPTQFDCEAPQPKRAPSHAAHTDELLQSLGYSWDDIVGLKVSGAIA